jgi:capsular exopolysaccharide synthesis family protein
MDSSSDTGAADNRTSNQTDLLESKTDLRAYWRTVVKRWPIVVLCLAAAIGVTIVWTYRQPKIYEARCQIVIEPMAPQVLQGVKDVVEMGTGSYWANKEFYETQYRIIQSPGVSRRVVEKLGLQYDKDFNGGATGKPDMDAIARALAGRIQVRPIKDSRISEVVVSDTKPNRATLLADAVAETYIEYNLDYKLEGARTATAWLQEQEVDLGKKLEESELTLFNFRKSHNLLDTSFDDRQSMVTQNLQNLNVRVNEARATRITLEARRKLVQAALQNPALKDSLPVVTGSGPVQNVQDEYMKISRDYHDLAEKYGPEHPKLKAARAQLEDMKAAYNSTVDKAIESFENEYQSAVETERALEALMEKTKREAIDLSKIEVEYRPFSRAAQETSKVFSLISQRRKEINLTEVMRTNNVRILEHAVLPTSPVRPKPVQNLAIAAMVGLGLGIGLAFLIEALDNTLKTQADVENLLGVPVLGLIPIIGSGQEAKEDPSRIRDRDLGVFLEPKSLAAECCRSIRTNILFMSPDHPIRTMVVTSPSPQEGKTTTAANLAITLAETGNRVLIVDTDLRRPRLHKSFGVPNQVGVSSVIVGETTPEQAIKRSEVPNLDVMTCGPVPPNPAELLHTEKFLKLIETLKKQYDRIIFDSPPTSAVTDPAVIGNVVDGVILVVKGGKTTRDAAGHAKRQLASANVRILGVIVNEIDFSSSSYGYQYYNYRNYSRYGYSYGERAEEKGA